MSKTLNESDSTRTPALVSSIPFKPPREVEYPPRRLPIAMPRLSIML